MTALITRVLGKALFAALLVGSLATNVLLLTSQTFHGRAYDLVSRLGYESLLSKGVFARNLAADREAKAYGSRLVVAKGISNRIARRTIRNVSYNVSSVIAEAVPYIGAAIVVAVTAIDIQDGCDTIRDINAMIRSIDPAASLEPEDEICGMTAPSLADVTADVKDDVRPAVQKADEKTMESARTLYEDIGGTLHEIFDR